MVDDTTGERGLSAAPCGYAAVRLSRLTFYNLIFYFSESVSLLLLLLLV